MKVVRLARELIVPTGSDTKVIQAPAGERWCITVLHVANADNAARTLRLHLLDKGRGETAGAANAIVYDYSIAANSYWLLSNGGHPILVVEDTETVVGRASATNMLCLTAYGWKERL